MLLLLLDRGARVHVFEEDVVKHDDCIVSTVTLLEGASRDSRQAALVLVAVDNRETGLDDREARLLVLNLTEKSITLLQLFTLTL